MKVEQETHGTTGKSQIRKQLNGVHAFEAFNGFDLDDHQTLDNEIQPVTAVNALILVEDRKGPLALEAETLAVNSTARQV